MNLDVQADKHLLEADAPTSRNVSVSLEAPTAARRETRAPVNLAIVLDRSGSMSGAKIEYARQAACHTIDTLAAEDRFSVVIYDHDVEVLVAAGHATAQRKRDAKRRLAGVQTRGSTALFDGWRRGCDEIADGLSTDAVGRCLLLTDGLANHGLTDRGPIATHVAARRQHAISTSTFGVGQDFDEAMLQAMAEAGGGNFYFIERPEQIGEFIASEVGEVLEIVIPGAALRVRATAQIEVRSLNDYPVSRHGEIWRVELGALVSGQLLDPVIEIVCPALPEGAPLEVQVSLADRDDAIQAAVQTLRFEAASPEAVASAPVTAKVARAVAELLASRTSQTALEHNRAGHYDRARLLLEDAAARIRASANGDAVILALADQLAAESVEYGQRMDAMSIKERYFRHYRGLKGKLDGGRSRRRATTGNR